MAWYGWMGMEHYIIIPELDTRYYEVENKSNPVLDINIHIFLQCQAVKVSR